MKCEFVQSEGEAFLVFENEECAEIAAEYIEYICFACFNGYMNALKVA